MDEYQLQVPNKYRQIYEFDTIEQAEEFMKDGRVYDGHKYKKAVKDENGDEMKDSAGNTIYKPILNDNGKVQITYCPVGEMVVKCVEKASRVMKLPVLITGEYLCGQNWAECH